jgi:hypothetical protein
MKKMSLEAISYNKQQGFSTQSQASMNWLIKATRRSKNQLQEVGHMKLY